MNILFMPSWFQTDNEPNIGVFFSEQAQKLRSMGNNVTIAIVDILNFPYKCNNSQYRIIQETRLGIDVYRMAVPSLMTGHIPKVFFSYYAYFYRRLLKYMLSKGLKFDVIYAHSFWHAGYIGTLIKKRYHIPLIIQEHRSMLITGEFSEGVNRYLKDSVIQSDAFYCVSNRLKENIYLRTNLQEGIEILPNIVDDIFTYQTLNNNEFTYTFIGTLNENKRIMQLLRCFEKIRETNEHTHLKIAGDGPLREKVKKTISNSDLLSRSVITLGAIPRESVLSLLAESNVLILPSAYETFGVVCIEAMAVGRPVICTKNGAVDYINEHNGILIDVDSDKQLISAMEKIYNNYEAYDLKKISKECLLKYSNKAVMSKLMTKMNEIVYNYDAS